MNRNLSLALFAVLLASFLVSCEDGGTELEPGNQAVILQEVNKLRTEGCQCGDAWMPPVAPLSWNTNLENAAKAHSRDMLRNNTLSHAGSDGSSVTDRIERAGYNWRAAAENIARNSGGNIEVVAQWRNSSGHCKNMMRETYTDIGMARDQDYWTMKLAAPAVID